MSPETVVRNTRLCLSAFALLSTAVTFNMIFFQGRRAPAQIETAAIFKADPTAASVKVESGTSMGVAVSGDAPSGAAAEAGSVRPLPVATVPQISLNRTEIAQAIQRGLAALGYEPGEPDGIVGVMTRAAIMAYESDAGLPLTAEPSEALMQRLELGAAAPVVERRGAVRVKTLEATTLIRNTGRWLAALGYPVTKDETAMSAALVSAIRDYEAAQKMPETGRISAPLVARLSRAAQGRSKPVAAR